MAVRDWVIGTTAGLAGLAVGAAAGYYLGGDRDDIADAASAAAVAAVRADRRRNKEAAKELAASD